MMPYENITQASTPSEWLQSVTHEKENTKQSNANPKLKCLWCLLDMVGLHLCIRKSNRETKTGENITQLAVIKDKNYRVD